MPVKTSVFTLDGGQRHRARTEGTIFVAGVVAAQTFLTPPGCAGVVVRLLGSAGPAPSLPCRLCVFGNVLAQRKIVWSWWPSTWALRLDNKNDRLPSHDVHYGGKSCAPSVVYDDGVDDNRRSRTILVGASAAAHVCAELREFRHQFGTRSISVYLLFCARCGRRRVPRSRWSLLWCSWLPLCWRNRLLHSFISGRARKHCCQNERRSF